MPYDRPIIIISAVLLLLLLLLMSSEEKGAKNSVEPPFSRGDRKVISSLFIYLLCISEIFRVPSIDDMK